VVGKGEGMMCGGGSGGGGEGSMGEMGRGVSIGRRGGDVVSSSLTGEKSRKELKEKDGLPPSAAGKESSLLWANDIPQSPAPPVREGLGESPVVAVEEGDGPVIADLAVVTCLVAGDHCSCIELCGQALCAADGGEEGGKEGGSCRGTPSPHFSWDAIRPRGFGGGEAFEAGGQLCGGDGGGAGSCGGGRGEGFGV